MSCGTDLPSIGGIHFGPTIAKSFGVASRHIGCKRAPDTRRAKEGAILEVFWLANAMENEPDVVPSMSPHFIEPTQRKAVIFVEAHLSPDGDVSDGIAWAVRFTENMGMAVVGQRFALAIESGENLGAAFALVGFFAERLMYAVGVILGGTALTTVYRATVGCAPFRRDRGFSVGAKASSLRA